MTEFAKGDFGLGDVHERRAGLACSAGQAGQVGVGRGEREEEYHGESRATREGNIDGAFNWEGQIDGYMYLDAP